ncbi:hephaestin-like protein [Diadema antillarum]|uniref:hephaestin-like protein n=1 Tax=Diadema antillarum TaxID=105358 RepID=UPI003A8388A3
METTSKQIVPLQSSEGQRLLNETSIKQTLLVRIFSKQSTSGYCGVHTAALHMSARHFGLKYPDERQHVACDVRDVPFSDTNMFTFDETTRVVSSEKLVVEGASLSDLEELFRQHGLFDHFERSYADSCGVDNFRSRAVVALSHSDSRQGVLVNFKCDFIVNNKLFSSGHYRKRLHRMHLRLQGYLLSFVVVLAAFFTREVAGRERVYYVGIVEEDWDYSPDKRNEVTGENITADSPEGQYVIRGPDRIGSVYKKALYYEYTDDTYTERVPKSAWQGFLGPMLYAEVGDTILVHANNMASKNFSFHPHGVFYFKDSEGAVYEDNVPERGGDYLPPGTSHTYRWVANERAGPAEGGPNCVPWMYHSHIESTFGTNSGLVGFMLICRAGILNDQNKRTDVAEDFLLMFTVTDENLSYYIEENIDRFTTSTTLDPEDEDFLESNRMDSVNGYLFGSLPGLDVCLGDTVAWHIMCIGTEIDVHTVSFHGNVLELRNRRVDTLSLTPAVIATGNMEAINPGTWLAKSHVVTHKLAGAEVLYRVNQDCGPGYTPELLSGQTREYFIAAEPQVWNYGPTGMNGLDGTPLTEPDSASYNFFSDECNRIPGSYIKARYVQYTDEQFTQVIERSSAEEYLGILGPVIRAEVGDTIRVTFRNNGNFTHSIHPKGVLYNKTNEGMNYEDGTDAASREDGAVAPGETYVYEWSVPPSFGPTDLDDECLVWTYSSAFDEVRDLYSGLVGPLLICKEGTLNDANQRTDVAQEFILLFMIFDENLSWYIDENIANYTSCATDPEDGDFMSSNLLTGINGFSFANLPQPVMTSGQRVAWHILDLGKDTDQHTAYFHQLSFLWEGRRVDSVPLFPGTTQSFVSTPRNPGEWLIECHTNTHLVDGMYALYKVEEDPSSSSNQQETGPEDGVVPESGTVRRFFIGAVEVEWDYTPVLHDPVRSQALTDEASPGYVFVNRGDTMIGSRYRKALFREYEDGTFVRQVMRTSNEDLSLGLLGPVIRAEVGDTIEVVFKNMATRPYSIHPQNLLYDKANEGEVYGNRTVSDTPVQPQEQRTYTWYVSEEHGPSATEDACLTSVYYSGVLRVEDTNSGLVGPMVLCRPGTLGENGRRRDVDREFHLYFSVLNENKSWYLRQNIQHYCLTPDAVDESDPDFEESNLMHGINGYLYNNLHHLEMRVGERVAWNLIGLGDEVDLHTVHFHGHTLTYETEHTNRLDVSELIPGTFLTLNMVLDDPGVWLLHCHVNDHILGGMETYYIVHDADETTTPETTTLMSPTNKSMAVLTFLLAWTVTLWTSF